MTCQIVKTGLCSRPRSSATSEVAAARRCQLLRRRAGHRTDQNGGPASRCWWLRCLLDSVRPFHWSGCLLSCTVCYSAARAVAVRRCLPRIASPCQARQRRGRCMLLCRLALCGVWQPQAADACRGSCGVSGTGWAHCSRVHQRRGSGRCWPVGKRVVKKLLCACHGRERQPLHTSHPASWRVLAATGASSHRLPGLSIDRTSAELSPTRRRGVPPHASGCRHALHKRGRPRRGCGRNEDGWPALASGSWQLRRAWQCRCTPSSRHAALGR